jgi:uncharacterized tellurite resistance protein B-like protein
MSLDIQAIIADGKVDAAEVAAIRAVIYSDGRVSREEADMLFAIADATADGANDPTWDDLFCDAIYEHIAEDGDLSVEEIDWLAAKIGGDGKTSALERRLLGELASGLSAGLPDKLQALL